MITSRTWVWMAGVLAIAVPAFAGGNGALSMAEAGRANPGSAAAFGNGGDRGGDELSFIRQLDPARINANEICPRLDEAILHLKRGIDRVMMCCERGKDRGEGKDKDKGGGDDRGAPGKPAGTGPSATGPEGSLGPAGPDRDPERAKRCDELLDVLKTLLGVVQKDRDGGHCMEALLKLRAAREKLPDLEDFCERGACRRLPEAHEAVKRLSEQVEDCFEDSMHYAEGKAKLGECGRAVEVLERMKRFLLMAHERCTRLRMEISENENPLPHDRGPDGGPGGTTGPSGPPSGDQGNPGGGNGNSGGHGNNGVGNGIDGAPPGNPPTNDGSGTGPGNPGNQGGQGQGGQGGQGQGQGGQGDSTNLNTSRSNTQHN